MQLTDTVKASSPFHYKFSPGIPSDYFANLINKREISPYDHSYSKSLNDENDFLEAFLKAPYEYIIDRSFIYNQKRKNKGDRDWKERKS